MGKVSAALFVCFAAIVIGSFGWLIVTIGDSPDRYQIYTDKCRAAGGIPIHSRSAVNCARPDGGWIDVR